MSLFEAKKTSTFQKAAERARKMEAIENSPSNESVSSGIGAQMRIARDLQRDPDGTATTSEIAQEPAEDCLGGPLVLPWEGFNETVRMHNQKAKDMGHLSQILSTVHGGGSLDEEGNRVYKQPRVYKIPSDSQQPESKTRQRS